jgi:type III restriction enzyme
MFEAKPFQKTTIAKLAEFLAAARFDGPKSAFDAIKREVPEDWRKPYEPLAKLAETPYVCLRLPTGGGKTFLAAQALKVAASQFLERENNPLVLWLVPTDAIRRQTLETLHNPQHPNRESLDADFDGKLRIVDITDFSLLTPQDLRDKACIVVGTFAALRVGKTEGRKVYDHREDLEPHFASVPPNTPGLECQTDGADQGKIKFSFANILALVRPLVIVDEAHNATTELSYEVLQRINAGCVIEFTATPADDSNVLHHVSASVLKAEEMIKLPIILTEHPTWQEALTDAVLTRQKLAEPARKELDFLRPIVLIQAENKDKQVTVQVVEDYLVEHEKIEREKIAIATGTQRELDGINLFDPACKVEIVITVQALKEGWDCSFAYVFCSLATVHNKKDVEQLLGRVLRMPYAKKRTNAELNRAYAHVAKTSWPLAINQMHDRLVSMGFDEVEAAKYVQPKEEPTLFPEQSVPQQMTWVLREAPQLYGLPEEIRSQVAVVTNDAGGFSVTLKTILSEEAEAKLVQAFPDAEREAVKRSLAARREQILTRPEPPAVPVPLRVPQLCVWVDGELELVNDEHFLTPDSWRLLDFPAELSEAEFRIEERSDSYLIDVLGKRLVERHLGSQAAFEFADVPTNVTDLELSRQLERSLRQNGIRPEVLLEFIRRTVRWLEASRGLSVTTLMRVRFTLEKALSHKIESYQQKAHDSGYQLRLFGEAAKVETSYKYEFVFPEDYPATTFDKGGFKFPKHLYGENFVGEFDSTPEFECAKALEMCPQVKRWVRNVVGLFTLPLAKGNFYPDFVAELYDGRLLVVEYKGEHLIEHEQPKKNIGERWESKSGGKALFLWAVKKDAQGRDVPRQLQDKVKKPN